jgi:hypothetical protein
VSRLERMIGGSALHLKIEVDVFVSGCTGNGHLRKKFGNTLSGELFGIL